MALKSAILFTLLVSISFPFYGQKANPIIFSEVWIGHSWGSAGGFSSGGALDFQRERSLFTLRYTSTTKLKGKLLSPFLPIPIIEEESGLDEIAFLYGWRFIRNSNAFSFSVGGSYNSYTKLELDSSNQRIANTTLYAGVPYEANIKWFKSKRQRFRIYGLIPVGKPTAFGGSIGFKLSGNISQNSYGGLGIVYGLGLHKKYE